jgi:uncharacterized small protein (TIGR04563 family)
MSATDKRKQSLYFPETMLQEIQKEAARLDRSLSWIVQRCVKIGLSDIRKLPSVNDVAEGADDDNDDACGDPHERRASRLSSVDQAIDARDKRTSSTGKRQTQHEMTCGEWRRSRAMSSSAEPPARPTKPRAIEMIAKYAQGSNVGPVAAPWTTTRYTTHTRRMSTRGVVWHD